MRGGSEPPMLPIVLSPYFCPEEEDTMLLHKPQSVIARSVLSPAEIAECEQLVALCNRYENLHLHLNLAMLKMRSGKENTDFLYYHNGMLVGYLSLMSWGTEDRELHIGVVHPAYRCQGIFRALLETAIAECSAQGMRKLVLVCEDSSRSATACMTALRAHYTFSEHEMVLEHFHDSMTFDDRLVLSPANSSHIDALVAVQSRSFNDSEAFVLLMVAKFLQEPQRHFYLATFGEEGLSCREPVGVLRLDEFGDEIGIYAFGVLPEYRRRGYGRQMLEEIIREIRARSQKAIKLEVDTRNEVAINLYRSCGFAIRTTYNYYVMNVAQ
jgi:ribosomal protein S18 acetylase RimI-like enzyme